MNVIDHIVNDSSILMFHFLNSCYDLVNFKSKSPNNQLQACIKICLHPINNQWTEPIPSTTFLPITHCYVVAREFYMLLVSNYAAVRVFFLMAQL